MSEYPSEWRECLLVEVVEKITSGGTPKADNPDLYGGDIPFLKIDDITSSSKYLRSHKVTINERGLSESSAKIVPTGTLLLTMYGTIGRCCITTYPVATNQAIASFLGHPEVELEYLYYALESKADEFSTASSQTTQANISAGILKQTPIAIPPLPEQKKIAEILSGIDMAIENQRLAIDKLSATHRIACQKKISDLSPNSEMATIRSISNKIIDYRGKSPPKHETGVPLITAKNIRKGFIDMNPAEYIQEDLYEKWMAKGIPSPGDILVTTEAPLGNVAIAPSSKFAIGQRVICISPNRALITPEYLLACMKTDDFQGQLTASSTGSTVSGVRQGVLLDCNIPLPEIEWQRRIGNFDLNASKLINALTAKKAKLAILKQSLASDLLSGRRRVSV